MMSRTRWLITGIVILAITVAGLGMIYYRQSQQQKQLDARITQYQADPANSEMVSMLSYKNDLESRISKASLQFDNVRQSDDRQIVSSLITRTLFDVAKAHGMEITGLVASVPTSTTLEGVSFSLITLQVNAAGDSSKMVDFLIHLNNSFRTGAIESVIVDNHENTTTGNATADINMDIYTN